RRQAHVQRPELGTVVVTGAASGLGAAIARAIKREDGTPIALDLNQVEGMESHTVDLADATATEETVAAIGEKHQGIDAVVNAAGTDRCGPLESIPAADWNRVIAVNLLAPAAVIRAALPYLPPR